MSEFSSSTSGANLLAFYRTTEETVDSLSFTIPHLDAAGNEFRKFNSAVITSVIDEIKCSLDAKICQVETLFIF